MGIVGIGQSSCLHLYCDDPRHPNHPHSLDPDEEWPAMIVGRSEAHCLQRAKRGGWKILKSGEPDVGVWTAICPKHNEQRKCR